MKYLSTRADRETANRITASQAIIRGLAEDGGLYVPEIIPSFTKEELEQLPFMSYQDTAYLVMSKYLDFEEEELKAMINEAYSSFESENPVAVEMLGNNELSVLELWHGPSCAFKDMALQLLPRLLTASLRMEGVDDMVWILTATSGDTGKAALEGFKDVPATKITVFYPKDGVSTLQKAQMVRQLGNNVDVTAIEGNFDDAQSAVKRLFSDKDLAARLAEQGIRLSSANSINWGRLLPQIVYYVYTAVRLADTTPVDFTVPTGNFGDILAGYYAKQMGAPVGHLICASNANNVLTDFFATGTYNRQRPFLKTSSPSMDILVSSNLERLLYLSSGCNGATVRSLMQQLSSTGSYTVDADMLAAITKDFSAEYCDDQTTAVTIDSVVQMYEYLMDPHTAVGCYAAVKYLSQQDPENLHPMVLVSTASPFKFASTVLEALHQDPHPGFDSIYWLAKVCGHTAPLQLAMLKDLPDRFTRCLKPEELDQIFEEELAK